MFKFKILCGKEVAMADSIFDKLCKFRGPVCTISNFRGSLSSKSRKDWNPAVVRSAMECLAEEGLGNVVTVDRTVALVKSSPNSVSEEMLSNHTSVTIQQYAEAYQACDLNLPLSKKDTLMARARSEEQTPEAE